MLLFRELHWRFELIMAPMFTELIEPFERTLNEILPALNTTGGSFVASAVRSGDEIADTAICDSWLELTFGLLRDARESYDHARWTHWKGKVDSVLANHPKYSDRVFYESALWAVWNVEKSQARTVLASWQPSPSAPLAAMRKAALLAELDEVGDARLLARAALGEIRSALRNQGENVALLSMEGWCGYLLCALELSLSAARFDTSGYDAVLDEFGDRWDELRAWDCDPWPHRRYFDEALSAIPPKPVKPHEEVRLFDPGESTTTTRLWGDQMAPYLPAFAWIRLHEQVGIPIHLPGVSDSATLANACRWIEPSIGFTARALLVRAVRLKEVTEGESFSRTRIAGMDPATANQLYTWCFRIFGQESAAMNQAIALGSAQELLFETLVEALSRLVLKVSTADLETAFAAALAFHNHPCVRSHPKLHECSHKWFKRLFASADDALQTEWLPDLIRSPLFESVHHLGAASHHVWLDPMVHFRGLGSQLNDSDEALRKFREAIDWLLIRGGSEAGEGRTRAIDRLVRLFCARFMTKEQADRFAVLLWSGTALGDLPQVGLNAFSFLHLPSPPGVDPRSDVKNYIRALPTTGSVRSDGKIRSVGFGGGRWPLLQEVANATRPVVQLRGEMEGAIEWTQEEAKQLYFKARELWARELPAFSMAAGSPFGLFGSREDSWTDLGQFLVRAVIPGMDWAGETDWQELRAWIIEARSLGVHASGALPYVLLRRPFEDENIARDIRDDLDSDVEDRIAAATTAIRHWLNLASTNRVPDPSSQLLMGLVERVVFRCEAGIRSCLWHMAHLVSELPQAISSHQAGLLSASLIPWHSATLLRDPTQQAGAIPEAERPDIRVRLGYLAASLRAWYATEAPRSAEPEGIRRWAEWCASDPLPEIRQAFVSWQGLSPGFSTGTGSSA